MIELKLYGQPTYTYEYVKMMILRHANSVGIELRINEIKDIKALIADGIQSIPTIKVNDHINISYNSNEEVNSFISKVNFALLKEGNFGNMKKIIVPTDFSETSWNAVQYACNMAQHINGVVELTHCYLPSAADVSVLTQNSIKQMKEEQLEEFYTKVNAAWSSQSSNKLIIEKSFKLGFPVEEIIKMAEETDAYIVMGSTGDTGAFKKFFGSVSTTVAQKSQQPVFIIPPNASYIAPKKIAYACEVDNISEKIMYHINKLANATQAEIHLVHVEKQNEVHMYFDLINIWKKAFPEAKVHNHFIQDKDVNHGLNDYVESNNIDILVMTHKHRGFMEDLFHKSQTKQMSINSSIPLLVLQDH